MGYCSLNTYVLATHEQSGGNIRMLLAHFRESGGVEFIIGSYFHSVWMSCNVADYEWDWGHYFQDVVSAVDYWKTEVLGVKE
jgi:hypothetical protein